MQLADNHVVLPREDFIELNTTANDTHMSAADRVASTVQTTLVLGTLAAGVTAAAFGVAKATDWLEERRWKRSTRSNEKQNPAK